jgi:hypothetical protein
MSYRYLGFGFGFSALLLSVAQAMAQGQVAPQAGVAATKSVKQTWTAPRAADGHPDLQGVWANNIATPLERPKELEGRALLTDQEVAALKKKAHELFGGGNSDAAFGDTVYRSVWANVHGTTSGFKSVDGETGDYSSVWTVEREWENRTSLITDPPDGRMPAMTPEAQKRRAAVAALRTRQPEGPEGRALQERCITYGSPQLTAGYQSYSQIVQSSNAVAVETEMIHDVRIIPLDGRPHLPSTVQFWLGDSRGHWEGDTLVVDTTNYKPQSFMSASSEQLHVIERFTRTGPESLKYEITINDPGTWTKPWSLMIPLQHSPDLIYEYACQEGNIGLAGILAGARAEERAAAPESRKGPK